MKGTEVIARILKEEGTDFINCFPLNHTLDAAAENGIRPLVARNERMAVNMADGFSRMSNGRRIGVCAVQYGPGSEAAFGAVAAAAYSDCSCPFGKRVWVIFPGEVWKFSVRS